MPKEYTPKYDYPAAREIFGIGAEEFDQRIDRGKDSALFQRWILGEWASTSPGEMELSNRRTAALKEISRSLDVLGMAAFTAAAGSYLLDGECPPCIR